MARSVYCASASVVLVPEYDPASNSQSSDKQYGGSRMGKYREVCFLGNHVMQRISSNICCWKKV